MARRAVTKARMCGSRKLGVIGVFLVALAMVTPTAQAQSNNPEQSDDSEFEDYINSPVCEAQADLIIVTDSSGSIGDTGFNSITAWLDMFLNRFDLGDNKARIGVVQFTNKATIETPLISSAGQFQDVITNMEWLCSVVGSETCQSDLPCTKPQATCHTATGAGLQAAVDLLEAGGDRSPASRVVVVLGDYYTNVGVDPASVLPALLDLEAIVITIGIGESVNVTAMTELATPGPPEEPDRYIILRDSWEELRQSLPVIEAAACVCPGDCHDNGVCLDSGKCECDTFRDDGTACRDIAVLPLLAVPAALAVLAAAAAGVPRAVRAMRATPPAAESAVVHPPLPPMEPSMASDANTAGAPPPSGNNVSFWPVGHTRPTSIGPGMSRQATWTSFGSVSSSV